MSRKTRILIEVADNGFIIENRDDIGMPASAVRVHLSAEDAAADIRVRLLDLAVEMVDRRGQTQEQEPER